MFPLSVIPARWRRLVCIDIGSPVDHILSFFLVFSLYFCPAHKTPHFSQCRYACELQRLYLHLRRERRWFAASRVRRRWGRRTGYSHLSPLLSIITCLLYMLTLKIFMPPEFQQEGGLLIVCATCFCKGKNHKEENHTEYGFIMTGEKLSIFCRYTSYWPSDFILLRARAFELRSIN